jgi:SAM-dependent methyltransferase
MTGDRLGYLLDNRAAAAALRFQALGERALAARVGPTGRVLATDLDPSWAAGAAGGVIEVRRHDVVRDPPPAETFDLVHARLVLVHLPERAAVLARLAGCLRPGGWLVIEDADPALQPLACPDAAGPAQELANRIRHGFRALLAGRGADLAFGRTLPRLLRAAGCEQVSAELHGPLAQPAGAALEAATIAMIREPLLAAGLATAAELDQHLANLAAGRLDLATAPMVSARGRRPAMAS